MPPIRLAGVILFVIVTALAVVLPAATGKGVVGGQSPLDLNAAWQTDPIWYDGLAEYAEYESVRPIYGVDRNYDTVMITNAQHMDSATTTKVGDAGAARAIPVFKHNVRETIPTENYPYRFLTTVFVRTDSLVPFKVVMSSQEDCGSSYKQFVESQGKYNADQYVYFPGAGHSQASFQGSARSQFVDTLGLTLRSFPFEAGQAGRTKTLRLDVVPEQTSTRETSMTPRPMTVEYVGRESVSVPAGTIDTHHLRGAFQDGSASYDFWFAADSGSDWLNILVRYEDSTGLAHSLANHRRWAYWAR